MKRFVVAATAGMVVVVLGLWGLSPAQGIGDVENRTARMVGGGWVAVGDVENAPSPQGRAQVEVGLPCPGEDVGFNPQPDPPGHLRVAWGASRFRLVNLDASRCSLGGPDTLEGSGAGVCNGEQALVTFRLIDGGGRAGIGNPDTRRDSLRVDIRGTTPACILVLDGPLGGGNLHMVGDPADG